MLSSLKRAVRVAVSSAIAFMGAGGKTSAMFKLARELSIASRVVVAASTHLGAWQTSMADKHIVVKSTPNLEDELAQVTLLTGELDGDRVKPLEPNLLSWLAEFCRTRALPLLIEADGSRQKPLKGWTDYEPLIPEFVDQVIHVAGLSGLGRPLGDEFVHRPEIFSRLSGLGIGEIITPQALAQVLIHAEGGQKNVPPNASEALLLNQADTPELQAVAHGMAGRLLPHFDMVLVSSLAQDKIFAVYERVTGIILAAGAGRRFGKPKQLLDWKGQPFVRAVAKTAIEAGMSPVIVVTGANHEEVESVIKDLNVMVVRNEEWQRGQASSIRKGLQALPSLPPDGRFTKSQSAGAAIFLLADQPQVDSSILRVLIERHAEGLFDIVAPLVMDRRANPVLFDQTTFSDLLQLEGDVGGRAIFHKYRVEYLPWHDDRLLLDVDTPEQYQRLIKDDTL